MRIIRAQQKWLDLVGQASQIRVTITDLESVDDELRQVIEKMRDPAGITWLLQNRWLFILKSLL